MSYTGYDLPDPSWKFGDESPRLSRPFDDGINYDEGEDDPVTVECPVDDSSHEECCVGGPVIDDSCPF